MTTFLQKVIKLPKEKSRQAEKKPARAGKNIFNIKMKQEIKDAIYDYLSDGRRHTVEETDKYIRTIECAGNTDCDMLEADGIIKTVANLDEDEPTYFVELAEKKNKNT